MIRDLARTLGKKDELKIDGLTTQVDRDILERIEKNAEGKSRVLLREGSQVDDKELIISRRHVAEVKRRLKES